MSQTTLRPADLVVALALTGNTDETYGSLSERLHLSVGAVHGGVKRLQMAGLVMSGSKRVQRRNLTEFVIHGARYAFPPTVGPVTGGVPTAYAAPPLNRQIVWEDAVVWPSIDGTVRGESLTPLYPGAPQLVRSAPELYEALTLFDALRVGWARERKLARELLEQRLQSAGEG